MPSWFHTVGDHRNICNADIHLPTLCAPERSPSLSLKCGCRRYRCFYGLQPCGINWAYNLEHFNTKHAMISLKTEKFKILAVRAQRGDQGKNRKFFKFFYFFTRYTKKILIKFWVDLRLQNFEIRSQKKVMAKRKVPKFLIHPVYRK